MVKNNPNPKILLYICIGFILLFAVLIFANEYILVTGQEVLLETAPVDPRDILRGDYVTLRYVIESDAMVQDLITAENLSAGTTIYLSLTKDENGVGQLTAVSMQKPVEGLFIKTSVTENRWRQDVSLGINKFFVPQGAGREIERLRSGEVEVLAKVDTSGNARIADVLINGEPVDFTQD